MKGGAKPHKDMTDGEAAIQMALKHGCTELILLGSIGASRPDHVLGNYLFLSTLKQHFPGNITYTDGTALIYFIQGPDKLQLSVYQLTNEQREGYISVLPLTTDLHDVTLRGLSYPLEAQLITLGSTLGISNEWDRESDFIRISWAKGSGVVLIVPRD